MDAEAQGTLDRLGRYEIVGLLATGGMAEVYLGRLVGPSGFDRAVVIKRVLPHLARQRVFVDMFFDEARIVAKIRHPNVVFVHELAQESEDLFLVMEYVEGESLGGIMRRHWTKGLELGYVLAAHIVAEAAAGLHAAHELTDESGRSLEVVHRDISPQNVMVTYAGQTKLLDFGIAKAADRATRTQTGHLKGKYEYMSPEQTRGLPLDRRSDVFSLGILLYELATSRRLFRRPSEFETLKAISEHPIEPPSEKRPGFPEKLEAICMRALARSPADRYATALELRRDLLAYLRDAGGSDTTEELLADRMRQLFEDRVEEKRDMLRRVVEGSNPSALPVAEVDAELEEPTTERPIVASTVATSATLAKAPPSNPPPARSGRRVLTAAATIAVVFGLVIGAWAFIRSPSASPADARASAPAGSASAITTSSPVVTTATVVSVTVTSTPAKAQVFADGELRGETPVQVSLPRGARPVSIEVRLPGFAIHTEEVVPDVDQRLALTLTPAPTGGRTYRAPVAREPTSTPAPTATASSPFRKFN